MKMGIIPCPNVDSRQLYDEIFSDDNLAKKTASRMEMAKELSDVYREYVFKRYEEYIKVAPHFEQLVVSNEISEDFKDILEYVFDHDSIFKNTKDKIKEDYTKIDPRCCICRISPANTLDHYLSKSEFPEYTLFPPNLVPWCSDCNNIKRAGFLDENGDRKFLHLYFDSVIEQPVLIFCFSYKNKQFNTFYMVDESVEGEVYDIYRRQFTQLNLGKRMKDYTNKAIQSIFMSFHGLYQYGGMKQCLFFAEQQLYIANRIYGINHYEPAIYRSILTNKDEFEELIKHDDLFK